VLLSLQKFMQRWVIALFFFLISGWSGSVFARNYGEGGFGLGNYNEGDGVAVTQSTSAAVAPSCGDQTPGPRPAWLYGAIAQNENSILLFFTEADSPVSKYVLTFGTRSGKYDYGVLDMGVNARGQMTFLVKALAANTTYYFKVRAQNGCATGGWSNEISAKTANPQAFNQLEVTASELVAVPKKIEITTVSEQVIPPEVSKFMDYAVKVKVVNTKKMPISGAKVTMHSTTQERITNKDGVAQFENVEPGSHKVLIAYQNYEGEQAINLGGDVKEFELNITVSEKDYSLPPSVYVVIGGLCLVVTGLMVVLISSKKTKDPTKN
jgi:hypothetical protein